MEPVENEEGQRDSRDDAPGQQPVELCLDALGDVPVRHEGVENPECDVGEEKKGDNLSSWFGLLLRSGGADSPAGLSDDQSWNMVGINVIIYALVSSS